ncbi:hypothetical protein CIW48_19845 [Methylobacterium sp. P1-11]|uniref:hypothetical protein n=1 Tax=Methylobacterium sp. P1-11 TaxID=2024616 RepID=UPI0011EEF589|nr:hypothetical protein [Methylobacterium sp. P1-11]KAA0122245.1 hypothetical protein CIW48_19845 [Methylobacterium sp. P1-11]
MGDPEPDSAFRDQSFRVASEVDRPLALVSTGPALDMLGRKYDRFRTGVPLEGLEAARYRS